MWSTPRSVLPVVLLLGVVRQTLAYPSCGGDWNFGAGTLGNLVAFGDSYTDENRLNYLTSHNGSAPPAGWVEPESFSTAGGGRTWVRYVIQYLGGNLYDYAVSGAVCSNLITPRYLASIYEDFPSILEYEIPAFIADSHANKSTNTSQPFFTNLLPSNTVYAIWIGTNDLGVDCFLTDSQVPGKVIPDYVQCVFSTIDQLYLLGGRFFVLNNIAPLYVAPLYANASEDGVGPNHYWTNKPANLTSISMRMKEEVTLVNEVFSVGIPFEALVSGRWPGAKIAVFDVYQLLLNIYTNPSAYLNGTAPANVTGFQYHCNLAGTNCTNTNGGSPDSYMWYDELHPSEQSDRLIAQEFTRVLNGTSTLATYW